MNIAMMTNNYKPFIGGVPISVERLSEGLRALGHQVTIFAPETGEAAKEEDVVRYKVVYERRNVGLALGNCFDRRIEQSFREKQFDIIHVHHPVVMGQTAVHLGRKYSIPVVYTYHTRYEEYLHYFKFYQSMSAGRRPVRKAAEYGRKVLVPACITAFTNKCDLVFAPTPAIKDYLAEQGTRSDISVLPTGLDEIAFQADDLYSDSIRAKYGREGEFIFVTTARLEKEKNLEFLLKGAARLRAMAGDRFRVLIIGDGTERKRLESLSADLGLDRQVVFVGRIENTKVRHYLHASDGFLFASKSETQGIVLLEAMAAGCPVIAVSASGVVDVMRQGVNGYITPEDTEAWAAAAALLMQKGAVYSNLSEGASDTAASYHSQEIAGRAAAQYRRLVERKESPGDEKMEKGVLVPAFLRLFKTA